jgi:hypothetical protein
LKPAFLPPYHTVLTYAILVPTFDTTKISFHNSKFFYNYSLQFFKIESLTTFQLRNNSSSSSLPAVTTTSTATAAAGGGGGAFAVPDSFVSIGGVVPRSVARGGRKRNSSSASTEGAGKTFFFGTAFY